jgi:hypothetical protein
MDKRTRRIIAVAAVAAVIGIPGAASAQGENCVGATAQFAHAAFPGLAQTQPGAVGDWLSEVREDPSGFPWCETSTSSKGRR